jgi:hypothetical protein
VEEFGAVCIADAIESGGVPPHSKTLTRFINAFYAINEINEMNAIYALYEINEFYAINAINAINAF